MGFKKIVAFLRHDSLPCLEPELRKQGIQGLSASEVKGYGEYVNFFGQDWLSARTKIEIYTAEENAERVVSLLMECTHTGGEGDGIIAVEPVDKIFRVRTKAPIPEGAM
jgi:nitrogen regulatory protein P-II 1